MDCKHLINLNGKSFRNIPTQFFCSECKTKNSLWMCLSCGVINCGRYENQHAKKHFESNENHSICFDCTNLVAYCYYCDEYVVNDTKTGLLDQLRSKMQTMNDSENLESSRSEDTLEADRKKLKRSENRRYCKIKIAGLRNLGNTCFMNAVLQSLSNIQQFSRAILEIKMNGKVDNEYLLVEEIRKTFISLCEGSKSSVSPDSLFHVIWKCVPRFRGYQQQDAHEFLRYVLDVLHTELIQINGCANNSLFNSKFNYNSKENSIVTAIFGGILQNEMICLNCKQDFKKNDPFLDLSLDIPVERKHKSARLNDNCNENNKYDLFDCLASFIQLEELADSELYYCPNCKEKQKSTKKFWIRRLPNVLCLHLKRFRWNSHFRTKVDSVVEFPLKNLDMSKFVLDNVHETRNSGCGSTLYDLAAVIVHHGSGAGSGHYTAYATHDGNWYHFNDSSVTLCEEKTVAQSKAYILFYVRHP